MTSSIAITKIRTGNGDGGDTKLGGKLYRKGHPIVLLSSALDIAQSYSSALPVKWGDFTPREILQELLFRLGAMIGGRRPKDQEMPIQEIVTFMEGQIEHIASGLVALDSFIRSHLVNQDLQTLRAYVREAECRAVAARDYIELEAKDTSPNLIKALGDVSKALNVTSDWIFSFVWLFSTEEDGKISKNLKWIPWSEEKLRSLNI